MKFNYFGHDIVVLHSSEIRKQSGPFKVLLNPTIRDELINSLGSALSLARFSLIASVIDKLLTTQYAKPENPYEIALRFCLERVFSFMRDQGQGDRSSSIAVECRGQAEDNSLELAFRRTVDGYNRWGKMPFEIIFADKKTNSTGLQIADLVSHPIGRHHLNPAQPIRSFDVVSKKFRRGPNGCEIGWGLKMSP